MRVLDDARRRWAEGIKEHRKNGEGAFQGDPVLEAYEEHLDALNYHAEAYRRFMISPLKFFVVQWATFVTANLIRWEIDKTRLFYDNDSS